MVKCPPVRAYEPQPAPLGGLLKRCRARLEPESRSFGPHLRLPIRVGKAVSQEELAEALGISRQWYVRLESDRRTGVSPSLLARIADALAMDLASETICSGLHYPNSERFRWCSRGVRSFGACGRRTPKPRCSRSSASTR